MQHKPLPLKRFLSELSIQKLKDGSRPAGVEMTEGDLNLEPESGSSSVTYEPGVLCQLLHG